MNPEACHQENQYWVLTQTLIYLTDVCIPNVQGTTDVPRILTVCRPPSNCGQTSPLALASEHNRDFIRQSIVAPRPSNVDA